MNKILGTALLLIFVLATHANADALDDAISSAVKNTPANEPTAADKAYLGILQSAIINDDKEWLAKQISKPLFIDGKASSNFTSQYNALMTADVKKAVLRQKPDALFKNYQGIMIENGAVWYDVDAKGVYHIIAINPAPLQTSSCGNDTRSCFTNHGTLSIHANLRPYLETSGRRFSIAETEKGYGWPDTIDKSISSNHSVTGDFTICPVAPYIKGTMQMVCISDVHEEQNLKQTIAGLHTIAIPYGVTPLTIGNDDILITRAKYESEVAASSDIFTVMMKRANGWSAIPHSEDGRKVSNLIFTNVPHTYEDALETIYFLTSPDNADLYVLDASRSAIAPSAASFTLYQLDKNDDELGLRHLQKVSHMVSPKKYVSADCAAYRELNVEITSAANCQ